MQKSIRKRGSLRERFDRQWVANTTTGCHEWIGALTPAGYGQIGAGKRGTGNLAAHRVAWELQRGPIPEGLCVLHLVCDNPACVNIAHLGLGTHLANMRDMCRKGRQCGGERRRAIARASVPRGERHCCARYTDDQIRTMRALYVGGRRQCDIARDFDCRPQTVYKIVRGMRRRDIL